ncbi:MAG: hypothetical protein WA708_07475 [Acidobacteriaceae bacterium]
MNITAGFRRAFDRHRDERAEELFEIAHLLVDANLTPDAEPIRQAAAQCRSAIKTAGQGQPDAGRKYWGYDIAELQINLEEQRHLRPRSAIASGMSGMLTMTVQEYLPDSEGQIGNSYALLRQFNIDFYVDGVQVIDNVDHPLRAAWHLDTHLYAETVTHAVHPRFHFQFGGERLAAIDQQIRGVLMPEAPRIPCAPLDAILAVDFVLAQYCGERWNLLRDLEPRYTRLRKNPMKRYWSPYFRTLADCIDNLDHVPGGGDARNLVPNIFVAEDRHAAH